MRQSSSTTTFVSKVFLLSIGLLLGAGSNLSAQTMRMRDAFAQMPDSILPLMSKNDRLDCIDYCENNMEARITNVLGDNVEMTHLNDTYLRIALSKRSEVEMKMLANSKGEDRILVCRTYAGPARETSVVCYDTQWREVDDVVVPVPAVEAFWKAVPDSLAQTAGFAQRSLKDLCLIQISPSADAPVLTMTLSVADLAEEERRVAEALVCPITYRWDGVAFRKE